MYIRRKVFSVALDEGGEERYFSTNEIINEEAYLDELMYSAKKKEETKGNLGKKVALGAAGTAGVGLAGIYGADAIGKAMVKKNEPHWWPPKDWAKAVNPKNRKRVKTGEALQKPAQYLNSKLRAAGNWAKSNKGKTAIVAVPVAGLAGYGAYKAATKNKKESK